MAEKPTLQFQTQLLFSCKMRKADRGDVRKATQVATDLGLAKLKSIRHAILPPRHLGIRVAASVRHVYPGLNRRAGSLHSIPVYSKDVCLNFRQSRKASCIFVNTTRSFARKAERRIGCVIPQALYPADRTAPSSLALAYDKDEGRHVAQWLLTCVLPNAQEVDSRGCLGGSQGHNSRLCRVRIEDLYDQTTVHVSRQWYRRAS